MQHVSQCNQHVHFQPVSQWYQLCLYTGLRALRTMDMENKENAEEPERRTELTVQGESLVVSVTYEEDLGSYLVSW
jgi:hypothetical protein